jgi:four helix bundle protein
MAASSNAVVDKSYGFALAVILFCNKFQEPRTLSRQLLRSGTSIGANVEEAQAAQTRADFHAKMCVAEKEARETHYWLRLVRDSNPGDGKQINSLLDDCLELRRLLASITKSTKKS